eukprot:1484051-Alexandrium_andersonii.AAC.1
MAFTPTREQAIEALQLREDALADRDLRRRVVPAGRLVPRGADLLGPPRRGSWRGGGAGRHHQAAPRGGG